jgi:hypothetical protein
MQGCLALKLQFTRVPGLSGRAWERLMDLHRRALAAAREVLESNAAEPQIIDTAKRLLEEEKRRQRTAMLLNRTFRDNQAATPDR